MPRKEKTPRQLSVLELQTRVEGCMVDRDGIRYLAELARRAALMEQNATRHAEQIAELSKGYRASKRETLREAFEELIENVTFEDEQ